VEVELILPTAVPTLGRTAAWLARRVEVALADIELSLPQYRLLALLGQGSTAHSALADQLAVRPPSVTAVVDGLVARGLIDRTHSEDDRRRVTHVLTPEGERLLARADEIVGERLEAILACLSDEKRAQQARDGLALWHEALVAHRAQIVANR
jgi:long-chain acyl-CoA synthetase